MKVIQLNTENETVDHMDGNFSNNSFVREMNEYLPSRSLVEEILSVEDANSGNSLVENPEQD